MSGARAWRSAAIACSALLAFAIVRCAWVGDDAYISLRTVDNWLAGHGLVWNPGERVQTFTHPLWLLCLAAARALSGEAYVTTIALGVACSAAAVGLWLRATGAAMAATALAVLLLAERSFVDYATSGLENPLAYLLLALLLADARAATPSLLRLSLWTALLATTRYDLALLAGPLLLTHVRDLRVSWRPLALGMTPFAAWFLFAAFYYGTPFPITAYAKAFCHGVPAGELLAQGMHYLRWLGTHEPLLLVVLATGCALGLLRRELGCRALAVGTLVYTLYVVKVGGDFMAGRLLTPPFAVAACIVARWLATQRAAWSLGAIALAAVLACADGVPAWCTSPSAEVAAIQRSKQDGTFTLDHGILDERANYLPGLGLWSPERRIPQAGVFSAALRAEGQATRRVMAWGQVGRFGYEAGDLVHLVDPWLCDPLLMRLPIKRGEWRIGHFLRAIPPGWLEQLATGTERLQHAGLARFAATLRAVTGAPLFASERLAALGRLWLGSDRAGLDAFVAEQYRTPPRVLVPIAELTPPVAVGAPWFAEPRARVVSEGGLDVTLPQPATARALRLRVQPLKLYRVQLLRGDAVVAAVDANATNVATFLAQPDVLPRWTALAAHAPQFFDVTNLQRATNGLTMLFACDLGLRDVEVALPADCGAFDRVRIDVQGGGSADFGIAALGGLELLR